MRYTAGRVDALEYSTVDGGWRSVDTLLAEHRLPELGSRLPILTYGANRNPSTLRLKLNHYGYRSPGSADIIPVLRASLAQAEAVASGVSGQGYFYADIVLGRDGIVADELEVWVNLVDEDAARVLHESEGVRSPSGGYAVAVVDGVSIDTINTQIESLAYVIDGPTVTFRLGALDDDPSPAAFSAIPAIGRRLPHGDQLTLLAAFIAQHEMAREITRLTGITADGSQAENLIKFLNGQWWYRHHTGEPLLPGAKHVLELLTARASESSQPLGTAAVLAEAGRILTDDDAYDYWGRLSLTGRS